MAVERGIEGGGKHRAFDFEGGDGVRGVEDEAELCARDGGARRDDEEGEVGGLDGALKAIPLWTGNAAEIGFGRVAAGKRSASRCRSAASLSGAADMDETEQRVRRDHADGISP